MNRSSIVQFRAHFSRVVCVVVTLIWTVSSSLASDSKSEGAESAKVTVSQSKQAGDEQGFRSYLNWVRIPSLKLPDMRSFSAVANIYDQLPGMPSFKQLPVPSFSSVGEVYNQLPEMPSFSGVTDAYTRGADLAQSAVSNLRVALENGWASIPRDAGWWKDFAVVTGSVGSVVGSAPVVCTILASPGGPPLMAVAPTVCIVAAAWGAPILVRNGYQWFTGQSLNESALTAGTIVGGVVGGAVGLAVARQVGQQLILSQLRAEYGTYGGYKGEALSLTRQSLNGSGELRAQVQAFRANGYDIDHKIPLMCGWMMGIAPAVIGALPNLQALPASINRSIGSKGC